MAGRQGEMGNLAAGAGREGGREDESEKLERQRGGEIWRRLVKLLKLIPHLWKQDLKIIVTPARSDKDRGLIHIYMTCMFLGIYMHLGGCAIGVDGCGGCRGVDARGSRREACSVPAYTQIQVNIQI